MFLKIIVNATKNCLVPVIIEVRVNSIIYLVSTVVFVKDFLDGADVSLYSVKERESLIYQRVISIS